MLTKQHISILLLLFAFGVSAQDRLSGETSTGSNRRSGTNASFKNLARARIDVSGINRVMVISSFDCRYGRGNDTREGLYKLTDGNTESQVVSQTLKVSGGLDKGIGTLVYIFDASASSGSMNYILQHSSSITRPVTSSGTVVAIALTTSLSHVDIPFDLKSISSPVSATLNDWTPVSGLTTEGIELVSEGNMYLSASINALADGSATGEWKLQHLSGQSWSDVGHATSYTFTTSQESGMSSLSWICEDLQAGTHYFRIMHRKTEGSAGNVSTMNSNLIACGLIYEDTYGFTREFPAFALQKSISSTSLTSKTPVISHSLNPVDATDLLVQAQYVVNADAVADAAVYDLAIDQSTQLGTDQYQYVSSPDFSGGGGSVGLGISLQQGNSYEISLRHQAAPGSTLSTQNATLSGFQLTSIGNSIWTGAGISPSTWENNDNWSGDAPGDRENAVIPGDLINYPILTAITSCEDLYIESGASLFLDQSSSLTVNGQLVNEGVLEVHSDATASGSLIVAGQASGMVSYRSYLTADQWHIVSPPISGQSINRFLDVPSNQIPWNATHGVYGLTDYNETTNSWNGFFTDATGGDFNSGEGYLMRRENSDGPVTYAGELVSDFSIGIAAGGSGWFATGNPYTSSIGVTSDASTTGNFLTSNLDQLDPNYSVLYLWDEAEGYNGTQNNYKVIGNSGYIDLFEYPELDMDYLQAGQGFLVKLSELGGSLVFSKTMQTHNNGLPLLKSAGKSWDGLKLVAQSGDRRESTIICFHPEMTLGLDPSYDAGLLNSKPDFSIYTRLLEEDQGINFKIQCLPDQVKNEVVIPLGIDLASGGELLFFTEGVIMPEQTQIYLEDSLSGQMIDISSKGAEYKVMLEEGSAGAKRFFLHIKNISTSGTESSRNPEQAFHAYYHHQAITLMGMVEEGALALLFDIAGRKLGTYRLEKGKQHHLPVSNLEDGLYLVSVIDGQHRNTVKIFKNEP